MFKKLLAGSLALMMIVGCSSSTANNTTDVVTEITEPVEITFWHAMNGAQEEALTKLTADFMAENKNITVTLQNQSSYPDLQQKLTATYSSVDSLPTITQAYPGYVFNASLDGLVQDLKPYIENKTIGMSDISDIVPEFLAGAKFNDAQYGMPFNKSSEVLYYNADIFEELKLEVPTTMEELIQTAKTIYEKTGIVGLGFDSLNNYYVTQLANKGVEFTSELDVTSQESQDAVNLYLDGVKEGYLRIAGSDKYLSGPFGNGLLAMNIGSTAGQSHIVKGAEGKFTAKAAVVPAEKTIQQGTDIYMFSNATAEQKTAAFLYMKHLVSADAQLYWAEQTGYIPVRTSVQNSEAYTSMTSLIAPLAKDITKDMFTIPTSANSNAAYLEISTIMEAILSDKNSDVKAKLGELKTTLESVWAE